LIFRSGRFRSAVSRSDSHKPRYKHGGGNIFDFLSTYYFLHSRHAWKHQRISRPAERVREMTIDTLAIAARRRHFRFVYVYMRSPIYNASTVSSCRELRELINFVTQVSSIVHLFCVFCIRNNKQIQSSSFFVIANKNMPLYIYDFRILNCQF